MISRPKKTVSPDGLLFFLRPEKVHQPLQQRPIAPTIIRMTNHPHIHIDATGLLCPLPLMHLKKAVTECVAGQCVVITVTDEHAELDFETWCERFGHQLKRGQDRGEVMEFMIRVGKP